MLGLQPGLQGAVQIVAWTQALRETLRLHRRWRPKKFGRRSSLSRTSSIGRWVARNRRLMPLLRQHVGEIRQALRLFAIGAVKLHHSKRALGAASATSIIS
jgi:hypothetical protein